MKSTRLNPFQVLRDQWAIMSFYERFEQVIALVLSAVIAVIKETNLYTLVGPVAWGKGPVPNVTKTPLVAGQWQRKGDQFELVITANRPAPNIPVGGKLELLS